eukprot:3936977-Rhodomonas_salina.1
MPDLGQLCLTWASFTPNTRTRRSVLPSRLLLRSSRSLLRLLRPLATASGGPRVDAHVPSSLPAAHTHAEPDRPLALALAATVRLRPWPCPPHPVRGPLLQPAVQHARARAAAWHTGRRVHPHDVQGAALCAPLLRAVQQLLRRRRPLLLLPRPPRSPRHSHAARPPLASAWEGRAARDTARGGGDWTRGGQRGAVERGVRKTAGARGLGVCCRGLTEMWGSLHACGAGAGRGQRTRAIEATSAWTTEVRRAFLSSGERSSSVALRAARFLMKSE